jgi:hypothetical protein
MPNLQRFETDVQFDCPVCGKFSKTAVEVPEPNWGAAEKMSELTSEDQTEVVCNECETVFPAYVYNSAGSCDVTLDDYPDTQISADMAFFSPEEDEWLDNEVAADPHAIFVDSFNKTGEILAAHGGEDGGHLINRMVFAQQVSALEAYLGDTLIKAVQAKPEALARLVAADKDLNAEKFTLADIASNPGLLGEKVGAYLRAILYHNLGKVDFLYRTALDVRVLGDKADNALLLQAIKHRHDCVHRNGMDKDGNQLTVFTKAHVQDVANAMRTLIDRIETEVWGTPAF